MTSHDYNEVMGDVGIADLKARLSEHLRKVRAGQTLTVMDRGVPIACIVPHEAGTTLAIRRATRKLSMVRVPSPPSQPTDSLTALLEDRASR